MRDPLVFWFAIVKSTSSRSLRSDRGPRSVNDCGPVAALSRRARELAEQDRLLRMALPDPLRDNVRLADVRDGRIVFLAPSPAWAARLRTCQNSILAAARGCGMQTSSLVVRVRSLPREPQRATDEPRPLSRASADHLRSAARCVSDPEMRSLFLSLAACADDGDSPTDRTDPPLTGPTPA